MWNRTKRLINSYLDGLIEKSSNPGSDVRAVTRGEIARLGEIEVQARASVKLLEKELAEVELKLLGASERARLDVASSASTAGSEIQNLTAHRDLLRKQIAEATASAEKAKALREQRRFEGEDLAVQSQLSSIQETVSSVHSGFGVNDPAAVIDEMRARIGGSGASENDLRLQEADRHIEAERKRSKVDELLASYKRTIVEPDEPVVQPAQNASLGEKTDAPAEPIEPTKPESAEQKTLGRADPTVRPID